MKKTNLSFHLTFKPEQAHLSALLSIAKDTEWESLQAISEATGIPMGKSSGKVKPHLFYAKYMGLLDWHSKNKKIYLSLTSLGKIVESEDPGFSEKLTLLLCHCMIIRKEAGADLWSYIFKILLPRYQNNIEAKFFYAEIDSYYDKKVNMAPFFGSYIGSYDTLFKRLNLLQRDKDSWKLNSLQYDKECVYVYALALFEYWDEMFLSYDEITSDQLEKIGFRSAFGWSTIQENDVLIKLADKSFIRVNRQLKPFTILRLIDKKAVINKLYTELL